MENEKTLCSLCLIYHKKTDKNWRLIILKNQQYIMCSDCYDIYLPVFSIFFKSYARKMNIKFEKMEKEKKIENKKIYKRYQKNKKDIHGEKRNYK